MSFREGGGVPNGCTDVMLTDVNRESLFECTYYTLGTQVCPYMVITCMHNMHVHAVQKNWQRSEHT